MTYLSSFLVLAFAFGTMQRMRHVRVAAGAAALFLGAFAALRAPEVASDFVNYEEWYRLGLDETFLERPLYFESIYFGLSSAFSASGVPFRAFLFIVAVVSVYIKARVILKLSSTAAAAAIALLIFTLTFFLLHDFTQIRSGLAVALLYAALVARINERFGIFLLLVLLASGFHSSALFTLLFLAPDRGHLARVIDVLVLVLSLGLVFIVAMAATSLAERLADILARIEPRLSVYIELVGTPGAEAANPFSIPALLALGFALSLFLPYPNGDRSVAQSERSALVHVRRSILVGVACLVALAVFREIALRLYELAISFIPISVAIIFSRQGRLIPKLLVIVWCSATAYVYIFRDEGLVKPYAAIVF